ncbi:hypothetical protein WSM22_39240 [Cytophagales bacterium WSM2-2]|nr:hypothetical protein WSM22_39240 [Cytophagales bacterium WSM2-2]
MHTIKLISKGITAVIAFAAIINLSGCGGSPGASPSGQEQVLKLLAAGSGQWKIQSVTVDNVDKTSMFTNMTISFTSQYQYNVTNGGPVWLITVGQGTTTNGSFTLSADGKTMTRSSDQLTVDVNVTESTLELGLTWNKTTFGPGRLSSLSGNHVFKFNK